MVLKTWTYQTADDANEAQPLASTRRDPGLPSVLAAQLFGLTAKVYLKLWHRLKVEGCEHLPRSGPLVVVANHSSHLDALSLAAALPIRRRMEAYPVAAGDTFFTTTPTTFFAATCLNALPMNRRGGVRHALADLRKKLNRPLPDNCIGCTLILFPEGTRNRDGTMAKFKSGLGMLIAETAVPVVPCYLTGPFTALPAGDRFPKPRKITVRFGPALTFSETENNRDGWEHIATRMRACVEALGES